MNRRLSSSNATYSFSVHAHFISFFVRFISNVAILKQPLIKRRQKLANPRNSYISVTVFGSGYFCITSIFAGFILTPSVIRINPRNSTSYLWKAHFSPQILIPESRRASSTSVTCCTCSLEVLEQMRMSSRQANTKISRYSRRISLTNT